jgi:hypothetical protein
MHRRAIVATLVASAIAGPIDLGACGDKFLRVGRSARYHRYAAIHPASILIYTPATASRKGIGDLEQLLKRAGIDRKRCRTEQPFTRASRAASSIS